jgi:ribosomal protein L7/L12
MVIVLAVFGFVVGGLAGLMAVSALSNISVAGLSVPHPTRPARSRTPHVHPDRSKREVRYPPVPAPLSPSSPTPKVLDGTEARALLDRGHVYETPAVPTVSAVPATLGAAVFAGSAIRHNKAGPSHSPKPPPPMPPPMPAARPAAVVFVAPDANPTPPEPPQPARRAQAVGIAAEAAKVIGSDPELQAMLRQGHFIPALKRFRQKHGAGLHEAKAALEAWRASSEDHEQVAEVVETIATDPKIVSAIRKGNFIEAIKLYRAKTGVSLQDAKEAIDDWRRKLGR